jgi:hypothetical protein
MPGLFPNLPDNKEAHVESLVADVFREHGWKVVSQPRVEGQQPDVLAERAGKKYIIEIKRASEGRRDRVVPLMAQAILQAKNFAQDGAGRSVPVAIVVANHIPESIAKHAIEFAREHAPDVAAGIVDLEGFRSFEGHGLEVLSCERPKGRSPRSSERGPASPQLFSDLNQWMLKVLLASRVPEHYLSAPRGRYEGASQLAQAAHVSVMSAFRFVEEFSKERFLERERHGLQLVRIRELMDRWLAASQRRVPEIAVRWILRKGKRGLAEALRAYVHAMENAPSKSSDARKERMKRRRPRACLGLFAAAEALGIGFVHGVQPYLYIESVEQSVLENLGLSTIGAEQNPDAYVRIPRSRESIFRGVVLNNGVPASDIFQVWLDVSQHPSRGREQAELIWRKILAPLLLAKDER